MNFDCVNKSSVKRSLFNIKLAFIISLICLVFLSFYLLTDGHIIHPPGPVGFTGVFPDMLRHLMHLDVSSSPSAIQSEAFTVNGKTIAYFLPVPALAHGVLSLFHLGENVNASMLMAVALFSTFSGFVYLVMLEIIPSIVRPSQFIQIFFLVFIVFCSPIIVMLSDTIVFWEAIIWAAAMFMICLYMSIAIFFKPKKTLRLVFFSLVSGIALFTRPNVTVSVIALFFLTIIGLFLCSVKRINDCAMIKKTTYRKRELLVASVLFFLFLAMLGELNFARWGNPFKFMDLTKNAQYVGPYIQRGEDIKKYGTIRLDRVPEGFSYHFLPYKDNYSKESPFIKLGEHNYFKGVSKNIELHEATLPIPLILPVFSLLAFLGGGMFVFRFFSFWKKRTLKDFEWCFFPAAVVAWIPGLLTLAFTAQSMRYRGDFLPAITLFSVYAIVVFLKCIFSKKSQEKENNQNKLSEKYKHGFFVIFLFILAIFSLYMSIAGEMTERKHWRPEQNHIANQMPLFFSQLK